MTSIFQLLSKSEVPPSPLAEPGAYQKWLDWMEKRRDPKNKEPWVETIRYDLNRYGYRCDEFEDPKGIRLFTVGSSYSFGTAIPYDSTYSYQVARMLEHELRVPVTNWNLSSAGKNADYIARIVSSAVPKLKPHLAIINFSVIARREFITEGCRVIGYTPNVPEWIIRDVMYPEAYDIYKAFDQLASRPDDIRNFTLNYRLCKEILERCGVIWCYSTLEQSASEEIAAIEGDNNHIGDFLISDHSAADGSHPGPEANRKFAEAIMRHLKITGKLNSLQEVLDAER